MTINGDQWQRLIQESIKKIRVYGIKSDKVVLQMDLTGRLNTLEWYQAIVRGPVVLARDTRFGDGFFYESAVVNGRTEKLTLIPSIKSLKMSGCLLQPLWYLAPIWKYVWYSLAD